MRQSTNQTDNLLARSALAALLGGAAIGALGYLTLVDRTDRTHWSDLPCLATHTEAYEYRDDRPHKQGGRGGMLTGQRTTCVERATVGPVMPRGWKPG